MIFYQVLIQIYIKIYLKWINKYKTKITLNFSLYLNSWCRKSLILKKIVITMMKSKAGPKNR